MPRFDCTWRNDGVLIIYRWGGSGTEGIELEFDAGSEAVAAIIAQRIEKDMQQMVTAIRRAAYKAGKRAARSKGPKIADDDFNDCLNDPVVGWGEGPDGWEEA